MINNRQGGDPGLFEEISTAMQRKLYQELQANCYEGFRIKKRMMSDLGHHSLSRQGAGFFVKILVTCRLI